MFVMTLELDLFWNESPRPAAVRRSADHGARASSPPSGTHAHRTIGARYERLVAGGPSSPGAWPARRTQGLGRRDHLRLVGGERSVDEGRGRPSQVTAPPGAAVAGSGDCGSKTTSTICQCLVRCSSSSTATATMSRRFPGTFV